MYKVFINEKALVLTDKYEDYQSDYDTLYLRHSNNDTLKQSIDLLIESEVLSSMCIYSENVDELWETFKSNYQVIEAAGGIVRNSDRILFIMKNNHWDLPKGKMENGEKAQESALREVKEECGIGDLSLGDEMETTYYVYTDKDDNILKKTNWYQMNTAEEGPFQGDEKEGIVEVKWMNASEWDGAKSKSYPSVIELINSVF